MSPTEIQRSQPVPTSHTWECPITTPPYTHKQKLTKMLVSTAHHTPLLPPTVPVLLQSLQFHLQPNRTERHTPDPHSHPQRPFLQATPRDLGSHAVQPTDPQTTLGLTPREGVELVTHTQLTTPPPEGTHRAPPGAQHPTPSPHTH